MLRRATLAAAARVAGQGSLRRASGSVAAKKLRLDPMLENIISRFSESTKTGNMVEDKSRKLVNDFRKLQGVRVQNVLLVCSDYDSYTFEEDGLLTEMVGAGYGERNLTKPPSIERVNSTVKALQRFKESKYDMVISLLRMDGHRAFISAIHQLDPSMPIALLGLNPAELQANIALHSTSGQVCSTQHLTTLHLMQGLFESSFCILVHRITPHSL